MKVIFAEIVSSLVSASEGAILAAVTYIVNRGVKQPLNRKKK